MSQLPFDRAFTRLHQQINRLFNDFDYYDVPMSAWDPLPMLFPSPYAATFLLTEPTTERDDRDQEMKPADSAAAGNDQKQTPAAEAPTAPAAPAPAAPSTAATNGSSAADAAPDQKQKQMQVQGQGRAGQQSLLAPSWRSYQMMPAINAHETDKAFIVSAEVPGVGKDELKVSVDKNILTISGEKKEEKKEERSNYVRHERRFGSYSRSLSLPENADVEHISATHQNGVLTLTIPKLEIKKPEPRHITIA